MGDRRSFAKSADDGVRDRPQAHAEKAGAAHASDEAGRTSPSGPAQVQAAGQPWPVFAESGKPYLIKRGRGAAPAEGLVEGVYVVPEWVQRAPDVAHGSGGLQSESRARELIAALGWVAPEHVAFAARELRFRMGHGGNYLRMSASALGVLGLQPGQREAVQRSSQGGVVVVIPTDQAESPGATRPLTPSEQTHVLDAVARYTKLPVRDAARDAARAHLQTGEVGAGTLKLHVSHELCVAMFGETDYAVWAGYLRKPVAPDSAKLKLENFYRMPVPGRLMHHGDVVEAGERVWLEVDVAWPEGAPNAEQYHTPGKYAEGHRGQPVAVLDVEWAIRRVDGQQSHPAPSAEAVSRPMAPLQTAPERTQDSPLGGQLQSRPDAGVVYAQTRKAEVAHVFRLNADEAAGTFEVTARARNAAYFEPATFTLQVPVVTPTVAVAQARAAALTAMQATEVRTQPWQFASAAFGSGNDIHGTRTEGRLHADAARTPAVDSPEVAAHVAADPRAALRADEVHRLKAMRMMLAAQGPASRAAVAGVDRELAWLAHTEALLAVSRQGGRQPFAVRGSYLAREEGVASGPLDLYGSVETYELELNERRGRRDVMVQLRDVSRRIESWDLTFTGQGPTFEAALERAFYNLAKAYPNGVVALQAEEINVEAIRQPDGGAGREAVPGASPSTGRTLGYELGTSTRWERTKAVVWSPVATVATNLALIAVAGLFPLTASVVMPLLLAYNAAGAVDKVASEAERGTLTLSSLAVSTGELALNLLPVLGRAKAFTAGWYLAAGANWGGQAVLLTANALAEARTLQAHDVQALVGLYEELQAAKQRGTTGAELAHLEAALSERAAAVATRLQQTLANQVTQQALMAVAGTAAGHLASMAGKPLAAQYIETWRAHGAAAAHAEAGHPVRVSDSASVAANVRTADGATAAPPAAARPGAAEAQPWVEAMYGGPPTHHVGSKPAAAKVKYSTSDVPEVVFHEDGYTPVIPAGASPHELDAHLAAVARLTRSGSRVQRIVARLRGERLAKAGTNLARAEAELAKNAIRLGYIETRLAEVEAGRIGMLPDEQADLQADYEVTQTALTHWEGVAAQRTLTPDAAAIEAFTNPAPGQLPELPDGHIYYKVEAAADGVAVTVGDGATSYWNIRRRAHYDGPSLELRRGAAGVEVGPRTQRAEPEARFAASTSKAEALELLITGDQSFGPFLAMLERHGLVATGDRTALLAVMPAPAGTTVRAVRHVLKQHYLPQVDALFTVRNGVQLDESASVLVLRELVAGLNSSDMGVIGERWAAYWGAKWHGHTPALHPEMLPADYPELSTPRFPDQQYGEVLSDTKTGEMMATRDRQQVGEQLAVTNAKRPSGVAKLNGHELKQFELVMTHPDAVRNSRKWLLDQFRDHPQLSVRAFDAEGNMVVLRNASDMNRYLGGVR